MAPFRALATPLADMVQAQPYAAMYPPVDADNHPVAIGRTIFMEHVGVEEAALMLGRLAASDASLRVVQLRELGGAMARVPNSATAFAHRSSKILATVAAFADDLDDIPHRQDWVEEVIGAIRQGDPGAYVNFVAEEGEERVHDAYPGTTWDRLAAIKGTYDPDNLFHLNQNVPPAG